MASSRAYLSWLFLTLLAVSLFVPQVLALKRVTLPDGRSIRVKGSKPRPSGEHVPFDLGSYTEPELLNITRRERHPGKKPPPPDGRHDDNQNAKVQIDGTMCGLKTPSAEIWNEDREEIVKWFTKQYNDYLATGDQYSSIALFLRDRWAPYTVSSSLFCDGLGSCSIATCKNLNEKASQHDRQMALYVFEQIANADHLFKAVDKRVSEASNEVLDRSNQIVEEFSRAERIERALKRDLKRRQITMTIVQSLGLIASGGFGFIGGDPLTTIGGAARASANLVVNTYIAMAGLVNEFSEQPDFVHELKEAFHDDVSEFLREARKSISLDWHDLMIGEKDTQGRTILHLFTDSDFLEPEPYFLPKLKDHIGRTILGAAINKMWEFDRAYMLVVNNPGGCEADKTIYVRGPTEYLACTPEHPELGFWFYSADRYHENDFGHDSHANTRGPTGFWRLNGDQKYYGITLQDVVRSSYYAHKNNLVEKKGQKIEFDALSIDATIRGVDEKHRMNGVFTVPVCRNPGGEAISGVMDEHGQNYPCMCGEFGWNTGEYSWAKDETKNFLARSGFMFSEDWEDWCSSRSKNKCKGADGIDLRAMLNDMRKEGDPEIPPKLKHPFYMCKKRRDSKKHPGWPDRDMYGSTKRNRVDWAKVDEKNRNGTRAVIGFEG